MSGWDGSPIPRAHRSFYGGQGEGFRALAIALEHGLKVYELRRLYQIRDGEPCGPYWEMAFVAQK